MSTSTPRSWIVVMLSALALGAAGCDSEVVPAPPSGTAPSGAPSRLPTNRPAIERTLDANSYRDKPCALFTDEQARVLGVVKAGEPSVTADSAECLRVSTPMGESDVVISYYPATDLLGRVYRAESNWPSNSLAALMIAGQPAVRTTLPTTESCRLALGLADKQGVEIHVDNKKTDSCELAVRVAESIVGNLVTR